MTVTTQSKPCQPVVYNNRFRGDGHEGWSWECGCYYLDGERGLHDRRLNATAEATAHKLGEF